MTDYEAARQNFVDSQICVHDVTDPRVISAFQGARREAFLPRSKRPFAYSEGDIEVAPGRFVLDARDFSKLVDLAEIGPGDLVLEIGCGAGYSTAVLAQLAETVVALESNEELAARAAETLAKEGADNAVVVQGPLPDGKKDQGPYDVIVVNGAIEVEPAALLDQLKDGGRLVAFMRDGAVGVGRLYSKARGAVGHRDAFDAIAPVLPGFEKKPAFEFGD